MAMSASGLYYLTFRDALQNVIALDLNSETDNKIALFNNSVTPNFDTDSAYGTAPYATNEVSGTGWSAGGVVLTSTAFSVTGGTLAWTAANVSQASTTLTNAYGALIYGLQGGTKNAVCLVYFGGTGYSTSAGTFAINWNASGIFTIDLTP